MLNKIIKLTIFLLALFFSGNIIRAASSPDAIAIRVLPNPSHYSALRWYKEQGFSGSPQTITVDGYEAIRDGRTVYVNVANIEGGNLYTNIYLISYNQDAEQATIDIFGQILSHWKFNNNIVGSGRCTNSVSTNCEGTVGCWHFDSDASDSSGQGNNGHNAGAALVSGVAGGAYKFDGASNEFIKIDDDDSLNFAGSFTVEGWFKTDSTSEMRIIDKYTGQAGDPGGYVVHLANNKIFVWISDTDKKQASVVSVASTLSDNKFHSFSLIYDKTNKLVSLYIDGVFNNSASAAAITKSISCSIPLYIGINDGDLFPADRFKGVIDEIRIYDRALSAAEIQTNFQSLTKQCLIDDDCKAAGAGICDSPKAKITRDTRRLADLAEMKIALDDYKQAKGKYPELTSGTYLTNKTLSTWPSWRETLAGELQTGLPNDPINKLGECPGYDQATCWSEQQKKFADSDLADANINPPADSHIYVYSAKDKGASYELCGVMESGLITDLDQGACAESAKTAQYGATAENHPPVFIGENLPTAGSGMPYQGFVKVADPDNDALSWQFSIIDCPLWNKLRMENTAIANQKAIKADNAGQAVDCKINIAASDNREGGQINKDFIIKVVNGHIPIITLISDKTAVIGKNLVFTIAATEADHQYPLSFNISGAPAGFNSTSDLDANKHDLNVSGVVIDTTKEYETTVIASDSYKGESNPANFKINVVNHPPAFASTAPTNAAACVNYSYAAHANDPDGHTVSYFDPANSLPPAGLSINQNTGAISGNPQNTGAFHINIEARDQYYGQTDPQTNAKAEQSWDLNIAPENFTVNPPADSDVWVFANGGAGLYYNPGSGYPTQYNATASVSTGNHVVYKLSDTAHPVPAASLAITSNFSITIGADGKIQGTPTDNVGDPGAHTVIVTATNDCGVAKNANFIIIVKKNEWCGDGTCHSAALSVENCAICVADCACGANANCDGGGMCQCAASWIDCEGNKANGCECHQSVGGTCSGLICVYYCIFDTSTYGNCIFQ